ncbi:precorrin-6y C5,15-methyltransferase (decarboxylating), CbiE subunit [Haloterrigena turkmenica DSM 5511]|uniref:Precorrin-6y C5,15-methyltransferase (Decarboxylating), CbiE subunit n=1 Tax=Haloterrigena turkmenica (strain ATCC 51198 / DSM 5511 / JCM 9101 / NCIMB 13204 / VKM B-1734 / 4k) TaxID=543526 RepID=D2RYJ6_HALTV|nr:cobalt-precorrin-7 (C(5))-methyltransferase [Haloterrigena turkmenica]ADB59897.1 precorrin-6y C5,15-methyltransferase (decarboxylating), CbiE subunit [Haloterrigena turkmenica DSM 5511]
MSDEYDLEAGPDPATFAAAAPEPNIDEETEDPVYAVGVGPGNQEYLTPRGERAIREADVVVGFTTVVEFVEDLTDADLLTCGYKDEAEALEAFGERVAAGESGTAVAMGDPNHSGYQFVGKVQDAVEREARNRDVDPRSVRIVPGISSLQLAASRARTPMEDTEFVTLHKSGGLEADMERLAAAGTVDERHLLVLPRPYDRMPGDIAAFLLEEGADPNLEALVLEKLTHEDEEIHRFTLAELSEHAGGTGTEDTPFSDLVVLAVRQPVP